MKVFIDTNIVLDLLLQRRNFLINAEKIFSLAYKGKIVLYFSAVSFVSVTYYLGKHTNKDIKAVLEDLCKIVKILPFNQRIIENTLHSNFKDIEDGYQYFTAKENNIRIMITRNVKDFLVDDISVVTPEEFLMISC
ncbi:twitching motility protein PilT [Capnocytophaga leadbetteri]|jgi:pilT domain-containing protein|uniref:Twitching motility protein PilT n=1 Tax=Capnocytophaga leadbetteri TaxID=327575 RepID=A0A250FBH2_9FLAO|nr:PIN domain-containing protein [Capnocytophaga leadbetteri]ATA82461.1 twitching motility protein PilT [Capnocytophaga leadbetteri]